MACNVHVDNKRGFENMLRAFRRACTERGIVREWKKHQFYEKPSAKRRNKIRQAQYERFLEQSANRNR